MPSDLEFAGRVLLAALLGGAVGFEREVTHHSAGLRTHISVALGACLFVMAGAYGFEFFGEQSRNSNSYQVSVDRVASTVVTGVGFLGGGAIVKYGASVRGLTTAASLWVTAAIGLAVGLGVYFIAVLTSAVLLASLTLLRFPERWIERRLASGRERVTLTLAEGADASAVMAALDELEGLEVKSFFVRREGGMATVEADVVGVKGRDVEAEVEQLTARDDVTDVEVD